jgi:hypothetical protein
MSGRRQLGGEVIEDVRRVSSPGKEHNGTACTAPIEDFQPDVIA